MLNKNKKKITITKVLDYKLITIIFIILLLMISIPLIKNINHRHQIDLEISNLKQEVNQTQANNSDLQNLLKYLDSSQFTEEQARINLGLKKDGEEVVVVKGLTETSSNEIVNKNLFDIPSLATANDSQTSNNFDKWIKYFFN
jgi:cell division protein FtsB